MKKAKKVQTASTKKGRAALGSVLREARGATRGDKTRKAKMTQAEIAAALKMSQPNVSSLEDGEYVFPLDRVFDLADAYQLPLISLIGKFGKKIGK